MALYPYPNPAAMALNNVLSLGDQDNNKPKKPSLYRAGQAVGSGLDAAHQLASAGDMAADKAINAGVDATKLGFTNFMRGVRGQPALDALPVAPAANEPAAANVANPAPAVLTRSPAVNLNIATAGRGVGASPALHAPLANGDTGVTLPDGRKLPYGAMVGGVPTFSDGSGAPGAPPRTMTDAEIKGLGDRLNIVPATAFTRPAPTFNSDNTDQNVANIIASRQGGKFGVTPEMTANANLAAVVNQDPRSTLGRAALNAARRASGATTVLQRKAALDDQAALRDAVTHSGLAGVDNAAAQGRANTAAAATLQRQGMANAGALQQQALQNEGELARTDLAGQYGVAQTLASPKKAGEMTPKDYMTQLNTGVQAQIKNYNDQQALLPADQRQPLTDAAIAEMRAIQAKALGLRVGTAANGQRVVQINGQVVPL